MVISVSKIRKIVSLLVVLFLIFTVFSQSVSSEGLFSDFKEKTREVVDKVKIRFHENSNMFGFAVYPAYVSEFYFKR